MSSCWFYHHSEECQGEYYKYRHVSGCDSKSWCYRDTSDHHYDTSLPPSSCVAPSNRIFLNVRRVRDGAGCLIMTARTNCMPKNNAIIYSASSLLVLCWVSCIHQFDNGCFSIGNEWKVGSVISFTHLCRSSSLALGLFNNSVCFPPLNWRINKVFLFSCTT